MALIDKASLLMVPSTYEDGTLYNILPSGNKAPDETGNHNGYDQTRADFTFSRGSNLAATRVNASGLIEKGRENLFTQSNNFSHSDWNVKAGTFTQGVADPDGGNNAWAWEATNTDPYLYQSGKSINGIGTLSIWVKGVGSTIGKTFELRNASFPYKNITLTGEWQRVEHFNNTASGTSVGFEFGNPAVVGDVVHIYQAQYEYGLVATSYMDSGATTATAGVLENTPRIDYSSGAGALLLESQRTNSTAQSEYIGASGVGALNVTNNTSETTSPEGLYNATLIAEDTTTGYHRIGISHGSMSNATKTFSVFAKWAGGSGRKWLTMDNGPICYFDLENGTKGNVGANCTADIEDYGNGWYRCHFTHTSSSSGTLYIGTANVNGGPGNHLGNGQDAMYLYGVQAEDGASYPSSYVPTYGSAATRGAENLFVESLANELTTGYTSATLMIEFKYKQNAVGDAFVWGQDNNTYPAGRGYLYAKQSGFADSFGGGGFNDMSEDTTLKLIYRLNTLSNADVFLNGTKGTNVSGTAWSAINQIRFRGAYYTFEISQIAMYSEALTDAECVTLTTL